MIVRAIHTRIDSDGNEIFEHEGTEFLLDPAGACPDCSTPAIDVSPTGKLHQLIHDEPCPRIPLILLRMERNKKINEPH
ncbi:hypothetical protein R4P47_24775 [Rhodococcus sp. IEGM 1370]|uniref:hypothetical protein n=1 Tax=Rhodococcus sp. IEGM 1370 TaxID=3082222 RepID=UPI002952D40E|nr:hypothetical protein [Rhodococcus sp. IEGM 1370]MDV8079785.1 hypothetical protein [Rhodococcus sp. IEGM 1370]